MAGDRKVIPIGLRPGAAEKKIRELAADTDKVILSDHALERMEQREISDIEVYRILQKGHVMEEPTRTKQKEWQCKVVMRLKGNRDAGVVTIILHSGRLFVKTVEWEDLRRGR